MKPEQTFFSRWAIYIILVAVFLMPGIGGGALRAVKTNRNQVKEWLPATYSETADFNWFLKHFAGGPFVLMSWDGCTLDDPRLSLLSAKLDPKAIAKRRPETPKLISRVVTGKQLLADLMAEPTKLKPEEARARLDQALIGTNGDTCALINFGVDGEEDPRGTLNLIKQIAIDECGIPESTMHLGGPPVDNVALDEAGEKSLFRLAGLTGVVGLAVSWWCLRSWRLILMVFIGGIYASAASLSIVWYSGGTMNSILLTMFPLVYVATMSGAIHLSNYYTEAARHTGVRTAPGTALKQAAIPLCLATGTTAMGLASLAISDLVPIQMFGIYSAVGVVISSLVLFLVIPSALELWPAAPAELHAAEEETETRSAFDPTQAKIWGQIGNFVLDHYYVTAGVCFAIFVFCAMGIPKIQTSVKLMNFFSSGSRIVQDYTWLEKNIGPLVPMEIVVCFDRQTCKLDMAGKIDLLRKIQLEVDKLPDIGSTMSAATFSPPPPAPPKMGGGVGRVFSNLTGGKKGRERITRDVFNKQLEKHRNEFIYNDYLSDADPNEEVWRISARVGALNDIDYGIFGKELADKVEPVVEAEREKGIAGVRTVYTGLVPLVYKSQRSLLDGLIFGFGTDLLLVIVVMMIMVYDLGAGLLLLIPAVFPGVVIFGLMGWLGIVVDVGTVMPPTVALGVTVDDVVHFLLWFRRGLQQGMSRRDAVMLAYRDCARPMYQSWGVIGVGLSVFALSPFTPTQRFGYLMITLLSASLVGNLLFLPALLASPMGWLFTPWLQTKKYREKVRKQQEAAAAAAHGPVEGPHVLAAVGAEDSPAVLRTSDHRLRADTPHRLAK
jgi:predicted RND superfamily exporter protein